MSKKCIKRFNCFKEKKKESLNNIYELAFLALCENPSLSDDMSDASRTKLEKIWKAACLKNKHYQILFAGKK